jgi:hypothetical protein
MFCKTAGKNASQSLAQPTMTALRPVVSTTSILREHLSACQSCAHPKAKALHAFISTMLRNRVESKSMSPKMEAKPGTT